MTSRSENNTPMDYSIIDPETENVTQRSRASSRDSQTRSYLQRSRRGSTTSEHSNNGVSFKSTLSYFFGLGYDRKTASHIARLKTENLKLKRKLHQAESREEDTCRSLRNILKVFNNKLGNIDVEFANIHSPINVQIGNNNTMIVEEANDVLVSFYETVTKSVKKLLTTSQLLTEKSDMLTETNKLLTAKTNKIRDLDDEIKQLNNENDRLTSLVRSLEIEREKFQEVVENLREIQGNMEIRDKTRSLKLDYTLSLTDSSLMEKSIKDLREMAETNTRPYTFRDISNNAKFGVMRILRKYCQKDPKLTVNEFAESLGVDVHLKSDCELEEDTCTDILTRWTKQSTDHTVDVLVRLYPRLNRYGSVRANLGSESMDGSFSMVDINGSSRMTEVLRQELSGWWTDQTKQTHELLNDIKSTLKDLTLTLLQSPEPRCKRRKSF